MKPLIYLLLAAAGCWILSEALEIVFDGRTTLTLGLTAVFHLLMVAGVWGAYAGQRGTPSALSRAAAGMASLGYLILVYPPTAAAMTPGATIEAVMSSHLLFTVAGSLATFGMMLFGVAILRHRSYAVWIGLVLVVAPPVFAAMMLTGGPASVALAANFVESIALIALGLSALDGSSARAG